MLDKLAVDTFADRVGDHFPIRLDAEHSLDIVLDSVTDLASTTHPRPVGMREPFTLLFRGPRERVLLQGVYRLEHAELGPLDIFLVPIEPDANGPRYEAIFG